MTLSDTAAYRQVIGCLMYRPIFLLEYPDLRAQDFDSKAARVSIEAIRKLYEEGAKELIPYEVDQEIIRWGGQATIEYQEQNGLEFLKASYKVAQITNFKVYYLRVKKCALLRKLKAAKYDISEYFIEDKDADKDPRLEQELIKKLDNASLEDILNSIEKNYTEIRNNFLNGGNLQGDPAEGINELIDSLKTSPSIGPELEGNIFSTVCRGAREGCFYLKSASTSAGKSRTSIFDACRLAYPKRWSHKLKKFIQEADKKTGEFRPPRKVLFIVTEMDKEELQTIMLAYLSGVDEDHILTNNYGFGEENRVKFAAEIMKEYRGYFIIEEVGEPNLQNIEATIKKYAVIDNVKYVFFDYIHSTASMISQFSHNNLNEATILMMMANKLKQIAHDYKIFIFSATQVNVSGMVGEEEELTFQDEKSIRGSKAVADKCDMGYVMTRIPVKWWQSIVPNMKLAVRDGLIDSAILDNPPTHVLDIYKMRRSRYKMVRIWTRLHLGTGEREDLIITDANNQVWREPFNAYDSTLEIVIPREKESEGNDNIVTKC